MDDLEAQTASGQPEATGLQAQVESLTHLVHSLMVLLIVISGTINIYFWHQFQGKRTEVNMLNQYINEFNSTQQLRKDFLARLLEFEKKNPDFTPIVLKYNLREAQAAAASPAAAVPPKTPFTR